MKEKDLKEYVFEQYLWANNLAQYHIAQTDRDGVELHILK